jgi:hypothetical protein
MFWLSSGNRIDGLWVGTFQSNRDEVLGREQEALRLIKTYDQHRYRRLISGLDRVWVRLVQEASDTMTTPSAPVSLMSDLFSLTRRARKSLPRRSFTKRPMRDCVVAELAMTRMSAAALEAVCLRRELAIAHKLPEGARVRERALEVLAMPCSSWTDRASRDRDLEGSVETLRHLGFPNWLVRALLAIRARHSSQTSSPADRRH